MTATLPFAGGEGMPPDRQLRAFLQAVRNMAMVCVTAKLGVADLLVEGQKNSQELAVSIGAHAETLHRLMYAMVALGYFTTDDEGKYGLTPLSEWLRSDVEGSLRPMAIFTSAKFNWDTWGNFCESVMTGQNPFSLVHGQEIYDYFLQHPNDQAIFNDMMVTGANPDPDFMLDAYDFSDIIKLVDVGGGQGQLIGPILDRYPHLTGVLFDMPTTIEQAKLAIEGQPWESRCSLEVGSYFETMPSGGLRNKVGAHGQHRRVRGQDSVELQGRCQSRRKGHRRRAATQRTRGRAGRSAHVRIARRRASH